jgi:hypothetical protein
MRPFLSNLEKRWVAFQLLHGGALHVGIKLTHDP